MHFTASLLAAVAATLSVSVADPLYSGFATYNQIFEGADNSWQITNKSMTRSTTMFLNVQILPDGSKHTALFNDFNKLCANYGKKVSVIPRLRYGFANGTAVNEPNNATLIQADVNAWVSVLKQNMANASVCQIPIVQAGTLGQWGEWHGGPFCAIQGTQSNNNSKTLKINIIKSLLSTGEMVAIRTPLDHNLVSANLTTEQRSRLTIHNDCMMAQGPNGSDTGTFVDGDGKKASYWRQYTLDVAGDNAYGGEPCEDTTSSGYKWNDTATVCSDGPNGLVAYINNNEVSYLNPGNPETFYNLFKDPKNSACVDKIQAALQSHD